VSGFFNNAHGRNAIINNQSGSENNAFGDLALESVTTGSNNTAIGDDAGRFIVNGSGNICIGDEAGTGLGASVNNCIAIGTPGGGPFVTFDNTCFIGNIFGENVSDPATQVPVYVDQYNVVGVANTSARKFKHDIKPMDAVSEKVYRLRPVTFKYNSDWKGTTQYGLIADEVAQVDPQLVVRGRAGEIIAIHYEHINNMLLNEFLKEHKRNEAQEMTIAELRSTIAQQEKRMEALTARMEEVSARLEMPQPATKVVANDR